MRTPTVSIVMATYNHANFVAETIRSVLAQTGVDFEFLIADDGSSDSTRDVVATFQDERIKFFPSEVNQGACVVTNALITKASGEFIALINSDDFWIDQDKLSFQVQFMRENPKIGACFGRAQFVDREGKKIDKTAIPWGGVFDQPNRTQGAWLRQFFDLGNCICHPTMLIRKVCFEQLGFYNNRLRQLPDMDMWIRLVKHYPIHIFDKELICFRVMPGENASSQTVENSIRTINEHYLIAENFFVDVTSEQLLDGFSDMLKNKDIPSEIHLDIEKALLLMKYNQWLGKPYQMIGILKLNTLLNSPPHAKVMFEDYALDDRWFQKELGEIDVLRPRVVAVMSQQKSRVLHILQRVYARLRR